MTRIEVPTTVAQTVLDLLGEGQRLSYDAVAKRAGVSRQTVYTHFPQRADLLLAAVEQTRADAGIEAAVQAVYEAPTATAALETFVDIHIAYVAPIVHIFVAVERERSADPEVEAAFASRTGGRRSLARHIATRLQAEDHLAPPWTVETACDLIDALTSGTFATLLLGDARWTPAEMRERLLATIQRTLLTQPTPEGS